MQDRFTKKLWHTNRKEFIKEFSVLQTINSEGNFEYTYFERNPKTLKLERLSTCQIVELQCTGLKDKNGKLIYEGDIVKTSRGNVRVDYDNLYAYFGVSNFLAVCPFDRVMNEELEVIGNIYENKELLNEG